MVGNKMTTRRGGKKRASLGQEEFTQVYSNKSVKDTNFVSPSSKITTQIIRTPDDLGKFTSSFSYGSTLKRRVIDQHTESPQISGRNLSPILRTPEMVEKDHSDSHVGADTRNSPLQLGDAPTPVFDASLQLKSVSHDPKSVEKKVSMDGKLKCASVTGGIEHGKSHLSQSVVPSMRGYEELNFSENSSDSLVQALVGNLPTKNSLPSSLNTLHLQNEDHTEPANNSEESHNVIEEVSKVNNVASSSINKHGPPGYYSLNTIQMVEEMGDELCEADSLEPNNALVTVKGYKVKSHHAGLLSSILSRHVDIGANCSMVSVKFRSLCMEDVCDVIQNLKRTKLKSITDKELESMMDTVSDLEKERVDVGWLKKRLDDIYEAKKDFPKLRPCSDLKQLHTEKLSKVQNIKQELEEYKRVLLDLRQKFNSAETALSAAETELSETGNLISEISVKVRRVFRLESLGDELV